jgi:TnpA family transposase
VERLAAQACTEAEEALFAGVAGRLTPDMVIRLEALIGSGPRARQSGVSWLRSPPGKAGATEMHGLIDRLDAVRHVGVSAEMLDVVPAHRIRRLAQEGRRLTAQNLEQMRPRRRHVTLAVFLLEALTDAAIGMFETLAGKTVRRAQSTRDLQLQKEAGSAANVLGFFASLGAALGTAHKTGHPLDQAVTALTTWEELAEATASAAALSGNGKSDNLLPFLRAEHARVRKFAAPFLAAFVFEGSGRNAALVEAVDELRLAWGSGKRSANQPWMRKAVRLADQRWRKAILTAAGQIDRKMLDLFLVLELKNRLASGEIWVKGSRAYRALDEHMMSKETFAIIKAEARVPLAIPIDVESYLAEKAAQLDEKLGEAARRLENGRGDTRIGAKGLRVPAVKTTETEAALAFAKRLAATMPPIRLTDLVADVDRLTGFNSVFEHIQTGRPPSDLKVFYAALIAEATNLGFSKMAQACPGISRRQLQQVAIWHLREETFALALTRLVEAQHNVPLAGIFGSQTVSSSDGQHIDLGDAGENAGAVNSRYGNSPIIKLYTHISGRYAPFHIKIIAATASEAVHVLDALLETEAGLQITQHHVDGGGVNDLVFALCHMLGFAFVPRIPDLDGRCLYAFEPAKQYGVLEDVMGERIDADLIRAHWDDLLRLATSIRTRTVSASLMLKRLSSTPRQSGLAQALRQMGRIERTLFTLDWISDRDLRQTTTAELNKGEARNSLVRAVNLHRLGRFRDRSHENLSIRASALNLVVTAIIYWNTLYMGRIVDAMRAAGNTVLDHLLASLSPLGWEHINLTGDYLWEATPLLDVDGYRPIAFSL